MSESSATRATSRRSTCARRCGLLRTRDAIEAGRMIGATLHVAGTIIADHALSGYAVVVRTPGEAREIVRNQAASGYSFIKVHNRIGEPLFDAVADEARRVHLDLVGHVPHGISLEHAIRSGGMRTLEHLKGFLLDQTLLPSGEPLRAGASRRGGVADADDLHPPGNCVR